MTDDQGRGHEDAGHQDSSRRRATELLHQQTRHGTDTAEELMPLVYEELRSIAATHLQRESPSHTLQPTALVHEAYLRLIDLTASNLEDRKHFLALGAVAIRRILIDHARRRKADRRGGGAKAVTLNEEVLGGKREHDILAIHEAVERLARVSPRQARLVELRFFGGLTADEAAEVLEITTRTAERDWRVAKAWLMSELDDLQV